jgi:hypothetical protein
MSFIFFKSKVEKNTSFVINNLKHFFAAYGFSQSSVKIPSGGYGSIVLFVKQNTFIRITIDNVADELPMKGLLYMKGQIMDWGLTIRLGDGGFEYPELLWSSIVLKNIDDKLPSPNNYPISEFQFNNSTELQNQIEIIKDCLLKVHLDFLKGNLSQFTKIRSEMVNLKEPDKIVIEDTKTGEKQIKIDEISLGFKIKYSLP